MKEENFEENPEALTQYEGEFSENKFWEKLKKYAKKAGVNVVYYALLLYYVLISPDVKFEYKTMILGALGYLILPLDLVPDAIPVLGFTDDAAALITCVKTVRSAITPEIEQRAQEKLSDWFDDVEVPNIDD